MKKWLKKMLGITALEHENKLLKEQLNSHRRFVHEKIADLKEYTRVDADIGVRGECSIILTGVYRRKGYVKYYDMGIMEVKEIVERMNGMKDHAMIRNIDAPPSFHGSFEGI